MTQRVVDIKNARKLWCWLTLFGVGLHAAYNTEWSRTQYGRVGLLPRCITKCGVKLFPTFLYISVKTKLLAKLLTH